MSDCTKRDIISYYNIAEDKIITVYQGCHPNFKSTPNEALIEEVRKTYNLPKRYIACVGTVEERKNLLLVAKAMAYLPEDVYLIAVGRITESTYQDHIYYDPAYPNQIFVCTEYRDLNFTNIEDYYRTIQAVGFLAHPDTFIVRLDEHGIYRWGSDNNLYPELVS